MAQWQRTLVICDVWDRPNGETIAQLAAIIADRIRELKPFGLPDLDAEREDVAAEFQDVAEDPCATSGDFDEAMERLYDWADTPLDAAWNGKKACWVKTI